jgi:hypothetical protein
LNWRSCKTPNNDSSSHSKKSIEDSDYWKEVEKYVQERTGQVILYLGLMIKEALKRVVEKAQKENLSILFYSSNPIRLLFRK